VSASVSLLFIVVHLRIVATDCGRLRRAGLTKARLFIEGRRNFLQTMGRNLNVKTPAIHRSLGLPAIVGIPAQRTFCGVDLIHYSSLIVDTGGQKMPDGRAFRDTGSATPIN
jgi:hypothetical protein